MRARSAKVAGALFLGVALFCVTFSASNGRAMMMGQYDCFIDQQYHDFLDRAGDAGGRQFYHDHLSGGMMTPQGMVGNFISSPEFADHYGFIARCYFAIFNDNSMLGPHGDAYTSSGYRMPDYDGMHYWHEVMEGMLHSGANHSDVQLAVIDGFTHSPEWQQRVGHLDDGEFVEFLYTHILGRHSDDAGHVYHYDNLQGGHTTRSGLVRQFIMSAEAMTMFEDHTFVTMAYMGLLDRQMGHGEFVFHMDRLMDGAATPEDFISGFIFSPEYINRLAHQGCNFPVSP